MEGLVVGMVARARASAAPATPQPARFAISDAFARPRRCCGCAVSEQGCKSWSSPARQPQQHAYASSRSAAVSRSRGIRDAPRHVRSRCALVFQVSHCEFPVFTSMLQHRSCLQANRDLVRSARAERWQRALEHILHNGCIGRGACPLESLRSANGAPALHPTASMHAGNVAVEAQLHAHSPQPPCSPSSRPTPYSWPAFGLGPQRNLRRCSHTRSKKANGIYCS